MTTMIRTHDHAAARVLLAALALLAMLTTGCGGGRRDTTTLALPSETTTSAASPDPGPTTPPPDPAPAPEPAVVARADAPLAVHELPGDAEPTRSLPGTTAFGTPTVVLVTEVGQGFADGWLEVLLPERPNGTTGWIRAEDVQLRDVDLEIRIDLADRELSVLDGGDVMLTTATAIGDPDHPTPTGRFYVTDKLETPDPDGAYGPYAIGLSAHSEVLTDFAGGDGQVGIHGTNVPSSIGQDVSHGCLRIDNEIITELAHLLPLGTPVTIA